MKCDQCDRLAEVHLVEFKNEVKGMRHLCTTCAATVGVPVFEKLASHLEEIKRVMEKFEVDMGREPTEDEARALLAPYRSDADEIDEGAPPA